MKRITLLIILLYHYAVYAQSLIPLAIESPQMDNYLNHRRYPTLTIKLINAPENLSKTDVQCTYVAFGSDFQTTKQYALNDKNEITITLEQNLPYQQIWLNVGNYLYAGVYVNSALKVTLDYNKVKSGIVWFDGDGISYSDIDGSLNKVMNQYTLFKRSEKEALRTNFEKIISARKILPENTFLYKADSVYHQMKQLGDEFSLSYPQYKWAVENEVTSEYYGRMSTAYWGNKMPDSLFRKINKHKPYFTSNEGVLFYSYLSSYIQASIHKVPYAFQNNISTIDSIYSRPKSDILKSFLLANGKDAFKETYPILQRNTKTVWVAKIVDNALKETIFKQKNIDSLLALATKIKNTDTYIGQPLDSLTFGATLYRLDTLQHVEDLIANLKSKYAHKALLIDFWATWCSPCLSDMPYSKKLHEDNKDLPVEFIYLCTTSGSDEKTWKNKIAGLAIPGIHIFINDKLVMELRDKLNMQGGVPAYLVIDATGKSHPNAINWMGGLDRDKLKKIIEIQ